MTKSKVSVIVVDYEGERYRSALLESLYNQTYKDFELIIVDNTGNINLSGDKLRENISIYGTSKNLGFSEGCNYGARYAKGEWIAFLNDDTVIDSNWLNSMLSIGELETRVGAVTSKVVFMPKYVTLRIRSETFSPVLVGDSNDERRLGVRIRFEYSWNQSSGLLNLSGFHGLETANRELWRWTSGKDAHVWIPILGENDMRVHLDVDTPIELADRKVEVGLGTDWRSLTIDGKRHRLTFELKDEDLFDVINSAGLELSKDGDYMERGIYNEDSGQYDEAGDIDAFSGCSVMLRKTVFEELGGFDSTFFAYYEDVDLSCRLRKAGLRILYEPKSVVRHHRSMTSGQQSPFFCFQIYRNKRWNIAKNARFSIAIWTLFLEFVTWIPSDVNRDLEYSAVRLKRETISGMLRYIAKRLL